MRENIVYRNKIHKDLCSEIEEKKILNPISSFNINLLHICPREQVFRTFGKIEKVNLNKLFHEKALKRKWVEIFSSCRKVRVVDSEVILSDASCNLTATADVVVEFDENIYVVNICPIDDNIFLKVEESGPRRKDVISMQAYIWLSELDNGILIYENIQYQTYTIYFIRKDKSMIESIESDLRKMSLFQVSGVLPEVPKNMNKSVCEKCEYNKPCFDNLKARGGL